MALLYCDCGHWIWSEIWWRESRRVLFFDDLETSETYGERVVHCPGCGRELERELLKLSSDEHSSGSRRSHETA